MPLRHVEISPATFGGELSARIDQDTEPGLVDHQPTHDVFQIHHVADLDPFEAGSSCPDPFFH